MASPPRLELIGIGKQYPAVKANDDVHLTVAPGQIHAVLGENGAGKSTLMKIIYGAVQPDEGEIRWNGARVAVRNPHEARALGISMVFQHFSLFDTLSGAENVWLGLDKTFTLTEVTRRIVKVAQDYGLEVDPARPVHTLSVGERQRVEIVRALLTNPKLLILDEPTSVLTPQAVERLFVTLRQLAKEGCSILYISHKLDEIRALCHHCTVLRAGKVTGEVDPTKESNASLSRLMIGAEPPQLQHREAHPGAVVLKVQGLSMPKQDQFGT
ncbi:MAG TPA: ATP-binding cassette domain-containing protein, partial [Burkholderiaceae bacterium]|nr:ATP-binding cassette domain-containing protein [Burkholderiaceae bacterium]